MRRIAKIAIWAHLVISTVLGAIMLVVPGRFLQMLGWAPIDPILSRVLGAALLALAWGDLLSVRAFDAAGSAAFAQVHLVFSALAALGVWRHLVVARWPAVVWVQGIALLLSALSWALVLWLKRE